MLCLLASLDAHLMTLYSANTSVLIKGKTVREPGTMWINLMFICESVVSIFSFFFSYSSH